ncbi:MAG: hypothetical protein ACOZNI_07350 [Myxococcota bacterium]
MIAAFAAGWALAATDPRKETQEDPVRLDARLDRDAEDFGIGVILGLPTGLSAGLRPEGSRAWFDAALAWSFVNDTVDTHADVLFIVYDARTDDIPDMRFPFSVGVGPRLHLGDDPTDTSAALWQVGVRVPVGMSFIHDGFPLEGFLELVPGLSLAPTTQPFFEAAVGARFYFGKKEAAPTE